ncbi:MAG: hypothetical protein PHX72_01595 [Candidatus Shapirobacteria bacterium]|nr:hypothetical protein [Candidatus Shapirobacteria bacterium]
MIKIIKKALLLLGTIYLASLAVGNIIFDRGFVTIIILCVLILLGQKACRSLKKTIFPSSDKISSVLTGFLLEVIVINLVSFLFKQVGFISFDSTSLAYWPADLLPRIYLTGFWSLLPFSVIIGTVDNLLIDQKQ